ncbi:hypothetical protein ACFE04_005002 [Oxalis oulophora]
MHIPILEACGKRKRRQKIQPFHSFPPSHRLSTESAAAAGPFRDNIRVFLQQYADIEDYNVQWMMPIWCTLLQHEDNSFVVPLYTIEEDVKLSQQPTCDHCRCCGWANYFVSKRKYHVIIPADLDWNKPLEDGFLDVQTHLLHGLIHSNGFGHLICINGIEGGSKYLCGKEIMDLWDRLCTHLQTWKITVEDLSQKQGMDLRLLHGVAYGHSWFGRWGYMFCRGSFGVANHNYDSAIEFLGSLELDKIIQDFSDTDQYKEIKQIIHYYRDRSETHLLTTKDLFRFMLTVKSFTTSFKKQVLRNPKPVSSSKSQGRMTVDTKNLTKNKNKCQKFSSLVADMGSRWPARRLEYAAEVIVDALRTKKAEGFENGGMARQDVRDAARLHIGDTGLLDYVLKSLNNVIIGNYIVYRAVNPMTRILEYSIRELGNETDPNSKVPAVQNPEHISELVPGADVYRDVVCLYTNVLLNHPKIELVEVAAQAILDSKCFVKEWSFIGEAERLLSFICRLRPDFEDIGVQLNRGLQPGELVIVPLHANVSELKQAVENAFRDTYCILEDFSVTEFVNMEELEDEDKLYGKIESSSEIWVRGIGIDLESNFRYQGGTDSWIVRCECGAQDDDGERMVACDICEVWQHTDCVGIGDSETVPPLFVCSVCCNSLMPPRYNCLSKCEMADDLLLLDQPLSECALYDLQCIEDFC